MRLIDILVILGCLAGGYWIVSSVMGPGVDITRRGKDDAPPNPRRSDWNLLLDVPHGATRPEIEAAYKRQLNKALASGNTAQQEQLRQARDAALAQLGRPDSLRE